MPRPVDFRAGPGRPCSVCRSETKGCSRTDDALHLCRGAPGADWHRLTREPDPAGFHHYRRPVAPPPDRSAPARSGPRPTDWEAEARKFASNLNASRKQELATALALPVGVLDALDGLGYSAADRAGRCWTFPERNPLGRVVGLLRRFVKPLPDGRNKLMVKGGKRGLILPAGWAERPGPVLVVEGPSDALAATAAGLAAVGRPSDRGGVKDLAGLFHDLPADRSLIVVGENDAKPDGSWPGRDGAEAVTGALAARLRRQVAWAMTPDGIKDTRAWLTAAARGDQNWPARGAELVARLTAAAVTIDAPPGPLPASPANGGAVTIRVDTDEHRVNDEAAAALATEPDLYQRAGMLVRVAEAPARPAPGAVVRRPPGLPVVREVPPPLLRARMTRCAAWVRVVGQGDDAEEKPVHPPVWCVNAVHARGEWPSVRYLEAVVTHPAFLPDGSILTATGYDERSGLLVSTPSGLELAVPDAPTRDEVTAATAALLDVVRDFPFERPEHRAAWLAGLLTPLAWFGFDGPAPLFLIDKNVRGAGAGLLVDVIALVITGRRFPVMAYTADVEELRKKITSLAVEGERLVLFDNLTGPFGCAALDAALTSDRWKDRLLGGNRMYDGPLHLSWYGTGNNVQLAADTARRVCHARLESPDERPELRTGLKYPELRAHVRAHRGPLLAAALTILRGWAVAGRPTHRLPPWGSFEGWSGVVREAVVFAGLPDPGETRAALQTHADRDAAAMAAVLGALEQLDPARRGLTTAELIHRATSPAPAAPEWQAEFRAAVEELCGKLDPRALAGRFRHFQRRNFGGRMLDKGGQDRTNTNRWVVVPVSRPPQRTEPGSALLAPAAV